MRKRIWELDALRGACILSMVVIHLIYDLAIPTGAGFAFVQNWGGVIFLVLSGICVTLGSHPIRRGLIVFGCGLLCTAVTAGMYALHLSDESLIIWFGVLHCLGCCMLLWPVFRKCPVWLLAVFGIGFAALGLYCSSHVRVAFPWLIPLGLFTSTFASSDYFPLLPNLGFFLLGAAVGLTLYRSKKTLLPQVDPAVLPLRFLCGCGRHSLFIYLAHQPVITGVLMLLSLWQP